MASERIASRSKWLVDSWLYICGATNLAYFVNRFIRTWVEKRSLYSSVRRSLLFIEKRILDLCARPIIGFKQKIRKNMPQELTPEQRLTQIEKLLESAVKLSHSNTAKIDANNQAIERIGQKVEANT